MEVERTGLVDAVREVTVGMARWQLDRRHVRHPAVNLVGRGVEEDRTVAGAPRRLEEGERTDRVDLEVPAGVGDGRGDGCLSSQMVDHLYVRDRPYADAGINDAADDELPT